MNVRQPIRAFAIANAIAKGRPCRDGTKRYLSYPHVLTDRVRKHPKQWRGKVQRAPTSGQKPTKIGIIGLTVCEKTGKPFALHRLILPRERKAFMDRPRLPGQSGFSLIELLTVVLIIGVLALIAIPQFSAQRKRGFEATLKADLRNAAAAEEAYFAQHQVYKAGPLPNIGLAGYNKSTGISGMDAVVGTNTYVLTATHSNCAAIIWTYTNSSGAPSGPDGP